MGFKSENAYKEKYWKSIDAFVTDLFACCDTKLELENIMGYCPKANTGHGGVFAWLHHGVYDFMKELKTWCKLYDDKFEMIFIHINSYGSGSVGKYLIDHCAELNEEKEFGHYFTISLKSVIDNVETLKTALS